MLLRQVVIGIGYRTIKSQFMEAAELFVLNNKLMGKNAGFIKIKDDMYIHPLLDAEKSLAPDTWWNEPYVGDYTDEDGSTKFIDIGKELLQKYNEFKVYEKEQYEIIKAVADLRDASTSDADFLGTIPAGILEFCGECVEPITPTPFDQIEKTPKMLKALKGLPKLEELAAMYQGMALLEDL